MGFRSGGLDDCGGNPIVVWRFAGDIPVGVSIGEVCVESICSNPDSIFASVGMVSRFKAVRSSCLMVGMTGNEARRWSSAGFRSVWAAAGVVVMEKWDAAFRGK